MRILITAGPTREYLDPVRFLSNDSSGRMGMELAAAFQREGHRVHLVCGPTHLKFPKGVTVHPVVSAWDMFSQVRRLFPRSDVFIATAAVSDWRFAATYLQKLKKGTLRRFTVRLEKNPDILAWAGTHKRRQDRKVLLVGFALETGNVLEEARLKLKEKNLDLIVGNTIDSFGSDHIKPYWLDADGSGGSLRKMSKKELASRVCAWCDRKKAGVGRD